jgi:tetratricopeptide (TPR) repeat protein
MVRREVCDDVGLFDEGILLGEDLHYFGLIAHKHEIWGTYEPLTIIRIHDSNMYNGQAALDTRPMLAAVYKLCDQLGVRPRTIARTAARCHQEVGLYHLDQGQAREARRHFRQAFLLYPRQGRAAFLYALAVFGGRPNKAYRALRCRMRRFRNLVSWAGLAQGKQSRERIGNVE